MRRTSTMFVIAALALIAGACSGEDESDGSSSTTAADATTGDSSEPDDAGNTDDDSSAVMVESTSLSAPLDQIYPGTEIISSGQVTANWYQEAGNYVVIYSGLDLESIGPACPGNSIESVGSFSSPSNAPTAEGGCEGATTPEPPKPPLVCGDLVVYTTAIATSDSGTLYGSFEQPAGDGSFVGGTSTVTADASAAPEVDTSASAYEFEGTTYSC